MTDSKKPTSEPTIRRAPEKAAKSDVQKKVKASAQEKARKDLTASHEATVADQTVARSETVVMSGPAGAVDDDKTQLSTPQLRSNADPDATVKTNPGPDSDKTVLTSQSALANQSVLDASHGANTGGTGPTQTIVRKYQRNKTGDLEIGSVIRERFVIEKLLGSGGMGSVYRALDLRKKEAADNEPYVAIKVLRGNFQYHKSAFITLQREAKKTQALAHPNIITVYDFDRDGDLIYITMEELKGHALNEITRGKVDLQLDYKQRLDIVEQIARGLSHAHEKGLVHSDLKPANVFLAEDGTVKILDFGIARAANQEKYQDNFDAGAIGALTAAYASLEMFQGSDPHPSDDIYALGIIACELLHGAHPYERVSALDAVSQELKASKLEIKNPFLRRFFNKSVALERDQRIEDAGVFLRKLNNSKKAPLRLTLGTLILGIGLTANAFYLNSIERVEKIPFSSLPLEQQELFHEYVAEAKTALSFGDVQGGVAYVNDAWLIHKSNKEIDSLEKQIKDLFEKSLKNADDEDQRSFIYDQISLLQKYPAFEGFELNKKDN